jgi:predicted SprT family Zn-dependent metalloprotease
MADTTISTTADEPTKMTLVKMSSSTQENTNVSLDTTVYSINKEPNTINIRTDNINIQTTTLKSVNPFEQIVLDPPDINFKNLKGYKNKEKEYKLNMKKQAIVDHINNALSIYTDEEKKYNTDIVIFVCQCAEDLITTAKSGKLKAEVVMKVCAKYFDDKEDLVMVIINLMYEKIIKTSLARRNKLKLQRLAKSFSK